LDVSRLLDISEARFSQKTAIVFEDRRYTYGQVKDRVQRLMTGLARLGVKKGDRVSTLMWNSAEMMEVNLAAMRLGAVFNPLNYRLKGPELAYVVGNARPKVLIADDKCQDLAGDMASSMGEAANLISTAGKRGSGFQSYEALVNDNEPFEGSVHMAPQDPCQLIYTSGTTARPKGVVLSHENVI